MISAYYNQLAAFYKLLFRDWEASVEQQAAILDGVIRDFFGPNAHNILDAACGIGTQSIGLAQRGYAITACDISPAAIAAAREEAMRRRLQISFDEVDMRNLSARFSAPFDAIVALDNALPHLLGDDEIRLALTQFHRCTTPIGGCIISVRDYASMECTGTRMVPRQVHRVEQGRILVFDVWEFSGDFYDFTTYVVEEKDGEQPVTHAIRGGRYYCVTLATLERLIRQAGFPRVEVIQGRFYQPLVLGLKG